MLSCYCMPNLKSLINRLEDQPQSTPKNLQLFSKNGLPNEWFMAYRKFVVLHHNSLRQRKLYQAISKKL